MSLNSYCVKLAATAQNYSFQPLFQVRNLPAPRNLHALRRKLHVCLRPGSEYLTLSQRVDWHN